MLPCCQLVMSEQDAACIHEHRHSRKSLLHGAKHQAAGWSAEELPYTINADQHSSRLNEPAAGPVGGQACMCANGTGNHKAHANHLVGSVGSAHHLEATAAVHRVRGSTEKKV